VALLSEIDNSGTGRSILGFGANDRPNLVGNPELSKPQLHCNGSIPGRLSFRFRNVWECGQEYSGGTGISECERVVVEEYEVD
jgi:hypothetical protein